MSGIFNDIPDVIIGDIFDYLVSNNLMLCKQSNNFREDEGGFESEIIKVCDELYEKLSEMSVTGSSEYNLAQLHNQTLDSDNSFWPDNPRVFENDIDFHMYLNLSSYFDQIQNGKLDLFEEELFENRDKVSYLSVCLRNMKAARNQESLPNNIIFSSSILEKKPWDVFVIQDELICHEMDAFGAILTRIFNSPRLFKIKESKNKRWPPEGPGSESTTLIPLKEVKLIDSNNSKDLEKIKVLQDQIQDLNLCLEQERLECIRALNKSSIAEYKKIKGQNFKKTILSLKMDKLELQKKLFNLIFNSQNNSFIDLFSVKNQNNSQVVIDLHNFNRAESINLVIFSIILILKYRFQTDLAKIFSKKNPNFDITEQELEASQNSFKGNFVDIYFCVGIGNHNHLKGNTDSPPKLASLIRRISFALKLNWRFGSAGFIIVRLQDNANWYRFIQKFLE